MQGRPLRCLYFWFLVRADLARLPSWLQYDIAVTLRECGLTILELSQGRVPCTLTTQSSTSTIITLPLSDTDGLDYRSGNDPSARQTCQFEDLPGHGKFRRLAFERLSQADQLKGVIFVVDAANLTPEDASFRDTISFLYMVLLALQRSSTLTRTSKVPVSTSVLVAVNKEDLFTALPANDVKGLLEVEITRLRDASDRQLPESGSVRDSDWIGPETEDFKFSDMTHLNIDISVIGGSALNRGELDACGWQKWVSMHAS